MELYDSIRLINLLQVEGGDDGRCSLVIVGSGLQLALRFFKGLCDHLLDRYELLHTTVLGRLTATNKQMPFLGFAALNVHELVEL